MYLLISLSQTIPVLSNVVCPSGRCVVEYKQSRRTSNVP